MENFLVFENINKSYGGTQVLHDVSVSLTKGEIFSLLGPSGCGKTTLLRLCAGFENPDSGRIYLNGKDITDLPPHKRKVNTIFQNYALFPHMTIWDNIAFGLKVAGRGKEEITRETERMLDLVQMTDHSYKKPHQISGGQKQRVAIVRALINKPQILLLDEPLAALDLKLRQRMLIELDLIHDEVGITFLFVTHDQNEAMSLSDRMAVMNEGRIEQTGHPAEIYESPVSSFTAAFIGDTNFFDGTVKELVNKDYSLLSIDGLPDAVCFNDRPRKTGDSVHLSLRPEKMFISGQEPERNGKNNILKGIIENMVYLGSSTKYWVRVGEWLITVQQQHRHFHLDEKPLLWKQEVWLSWNADDGYMLERYRAADESLLTLSEEGDNLDGGMLPEEQNGEDNLDKK